MWLVLVVLILRFGDFLLVGLDGLVYVVCGFVLRTWWFDLWSGVVYTFVGCGFLGRLDCRLCCRCLFWSFRLGVAFVGDFAGWWISCWGFLVGGGLVGGELWACIVGLIWSFLVGWRNIFWEVAGFLSFAARFLGVLLALRCSSLLGLLLFRCVVMWWFLGCWFGF